MKLEDVRFKWTSGMACPSGIYLDRIYHCIKKQGKLYFSDGNFEKEIEEVALKNIFTPTNDVTWNEVEFTDEVKETKQFKTK